ncbi:hypothetical protein BSR29_02975 [Boudabousia liubingyangii]|uniref:Uncharacterized protein n=1 Tax=Boudabousia liubingyangii TaxID=1921764 RepID=A0A1Q5PMY8_9ACTO|nr:hypothetical protein [Boudabousia liubingyangii]OKL47002.1 hypothetical protein BSR28_06175 [Boudabousia liubingyangii]OKL48835.1 hypothetical protein BSR29_02975 [Boudabousia liubingyangii]
MRGLIFPIKTWWLLGLTAFLALVCLVQSVALIPTWPNPDLRVVIPQLQEQLIVPVVIIGLAAAIFFDPQGKKSVVIGPLTVLSPTRRILPFAFTIWGAAVVGPILGWGYMLVRSAAVRFRLIDLIAFLVLIISLFAAATLAMVLANLLPPKWKLVLTPLLSALVVFVPVIMNVFLLAGTGKSSLSLAFMWGTSLVSYPTDFVMSTELIRLVYFVLLSVCGVYALMRFNSYALTGRRSFAIVGLVYLLAPALVFASSILMSPVLTKYEDDRQKCEVIGEYRLCLPIAQATLIPSLKEHFQQLFAQLPNAWVDPKTPIGFAEGAIIGPLTLQNPGNFKTRQEWEQVTFSNIAYNIFASGGHSDACSNQAQFYDDLRNSLLLRAKLPMDLVYGVNEETGQESEHTISADASPQLAFLTKLSTAEYQQWLLKHRDSIATCKLSKENFR